MRIAFALFLLTGLACNEIRQCDLDPNLGYATVYFFDYEDPNQNKSVALSYFYADKFPDIRYGLDTTLIGLGFPLDPQDSMLNFVLVSDTANHEIKFKYRTSSVSLYSIACGPSYTFTDLTVDTVGAWFDSLSVVGPTINKNVPVNVEIYF